MCACYVVGASLPYCFYVMWWHLKSTLAVHPNQEGNKTHQNHFSPISGSYSLEGEAGLPQIQEGFLFNDLTITF